MKENCFGKLYDNNDEECQRCILEEDCKKYFEVLGGKKIEEMTDEDIAKIRDCFGRLFAAADPYCRICILKDKCRDLTYRLYGSKSGRSAEVREKRKEQKQQSLFKQMVFIGTEQIDLSKVVAFETYEARYRKYGNPWHGLRDKHNSRWAENKNPFQKGTQQYDIFEWIKSKRRFRPEELVDMDYKKAAACIKTLIKFGILKYDEESQEFYMVEPERVEKNG